MPKHFSPLTARHAHDCDCCTLIGRIGADDCYLCGIGPDASVIRRHSSEASDYSSMPFTVAAQIPHFAEVITMALD